MILSQTTICVKLPIPVTKFSKVLGGWMSLNNIPDISSSNAMTRTYIVVSAYSLNELEKFIKVSGGGLAQDVQEGDYNGLVEVKS